MRKKMRDRSRQTDNSQNEQKNQLANKKLYSTIFFLFAEITYNCFGHYGVIPNFDVLAPSF